MKKPGEDRFSRQVNYMYEQRLIPYDPNDRRTDEQGRPLCRNCGALCTGRRTSYCCQDCKDAYLVPRMWSYARQRVRERDKGVCAECGIDTIALYERFSACWLKSLNPNMREEAERERVALIEEIRAMGFKMSRHDTHPYLGDLWQADHIVAVAEGGGGCGLDNLRTLCVPCHKKATKELHGRLGAIRQKQYQISYEEWIDSIGGSS